MLKNVQWGSHRARDFCLVTLTIVLQAAWCTEDMISWSYFHEEISLVKTVCQNCVLIYFSVVPNKKEISPDRLQLHPLLCLVVRKLLNQKLDICRENKDIWGNNMMFDTLCDKTSKTNNKLWDRKFTFSPPRLCSFRSSAVNKSLNIGDFFLGTLMLLN